MPLRRPIEAADPTIQVAVRCPEQIFNSIDPSPFHDRDIDEGAERFIVEWARGAARKTPLRLKVSIAEIGRGDGIRHIAEAVHQQFRRRSETTSAELRLMFSRGRLSALIGLAFLVASVIAGDFVSTALGNSRLGRIIQEGLTLLGWVSTWRRLEIYLYNWWPLVGDRRLYDRLAAMPVEVRGPGA